MELAAGVHRIDTALGPRVSSLYLFVGDEACLLFDTGVDGTATTDLVPALDRLGIPASRLRWVVISHADVDHFGGLASVREVAPLASIICHRADAPLIADYRVYEAERARGFRTDWSYDEDPDTLAWTREVTREGPVDLVATGGERIRLEDGWEVELLHVPGHSRGHLAIWDPRSRALAVSDAVLADAVRNADGTPAFPPTYRFVDDYLATVTRCESLAPELLLTAHYPTMGREDGAAFLATTRSFVELLDHAVLRAVDEAGHDGCTLQQLLEALNPVVGRWPTEGTETALAFPVVGHLERALQTGRLELVPDVAGPRRVRSRG